MINVTYYFYNVTITAKHEFLKKIKAYSSRIKKEYRTLISTAFLIFRNISKLLLQLFFIS